MAVDRAIIRRSIEVVEAVATTEAIEVGVSLAPDSWPRDSC
jgi:hypothetical protein